MLDLYCKEEKVSVKQWVFPAGEIGIKIETDIAEYSDVTIKLVYESSDDILALLLLVDAVRNIDKNKIINLEIPYFPYARQDRVCSEGESFSLRVIARLITSCNFNNITVHDMHSTVLEAFFDAGVLQNKEQHELVSGCIIGREGFALVAPDAGASKKIYKLAKHFKVPVIEAKKVRSVVDGSIIETSIDSSSFNNYKELVVVDDICDGGRTFVELAKVIRKTFHGKLTLIVTHGIFSNGFSELDQYYDEILFKNDLRKEKSNAN